MKLWTLSTSTELRVLRARLARVLRDHGAATGLDLGDVPERMILVATELATNAIKHGLPPVTVRLLRAEEVFVLDVADCDLTTVPELAVTEPADTGPAGTGGRGLHLAIVMSLAVGWYATDLTKHVWATFAVGPAKTERS